MKVEQENKISVKESILKRFKQLQELVYSIHPKADLELLERAFWYAAKAHQGVKRLSGEPFISHPLEVAFILADLYLDDQTITASLLHDTIEDTEASLEGIEEKFGSEIAELVEGVTNITRISSRGALETAAENLRKMVLAMAKDIRVILIKLADRTHNMRTMQYVGQDNALRKAQETLDIYAPIANRLGIQKLRVDLEDRAFEVLHPEIWIDLKRKIAVTDHERKKYIEEVNSIIKEKLSKVGIEAEISGRVKHYYSIYLKMIYRGVGFDDITDLVGTRIIAATVRDCYAALGEIHNMWKPVPGKFKDYIAMPKDNNYQSLHTSVIGPRGAPLEIQIRTPDMHTVSEEGIAAHWRYKEYSKLDQDQALKFSWLRQLLQWRQDLKDPKEFLDSVKVDLFPEDVYVFTPKGEVRAFPRGSSPIDFAYDIHTDVGHHCQGAKVNGKQVPLKYLLRNGDIVEILLSKEPHPSQDWLKLIKTKKAQYRIRRWLTEKMFDTNLAIGKSLTEKEFHNENLNLSKIIKSDKLLEVAQSYNCKNIEDLFAAVGSMRISPLQIVNKLKPMLKPEEEKKLSSEESFITRKVKQVFGVKDEYLSIDGETQLLVHIAKCCRPLPGDEVIGFITSGKGVSIHLKGCNQIDNTIYDEGRFVNLDWKEKKGEFYPVVISIKARDRSHLLAEISSAISSAEADITAAEVSTNDDFTCLDKFTLKVSSLSHLERVIRYLRRISGVLEVSRN